MGYLIDRREAFLDSEMVAIVPARRRGVRSRIVLRDGGLRDTLTRPVTLRRRLVAAQQRDEGATWRNDLQRPNR